MEGIDLAHNQSMANVCYGISTQQMRVLKKLYLSGGATSLFFCLIIFFITALFRKYQQSTQRLILYLTLTVTLLSVANLLHGVEETVEQNTFCVVKAFLDQLASWMVLLAECCVTFELFYKVVFLKFDTSRLEPVYCIIIFVVPFTFNWIPFIRGAYGPTGDQCWIKSSKNETRCENDVYFVTIRFVLYWIPFILAQTINFIVYLSILILTRTRLTGYHGEYNPNQQRIRHMIYKEVRSYLLYPILLLLGSFVGLVSRIFDEVNHTEAYYTLRIIHILAITFQGLAITLIFAFDYETRKQLKNCNAIKAALCDLFCSCLYKKRQVSEYEAIPGGSITDSLSASPTQQYGGINSDTSSTNVII